MQVASRQRVRDGGACPGLFQGNGCETLRSRLVTATAKPGSSSGLRPLRAPRVRARASRSCGPPNGRSGVATRRQRRRALAPRQPGQLPPSRTPAAPLPHLPHSTATRPELGPRPDEKWPRNCPQVVFCDSAGDVTVTPCGSRPVAHARSLTPCRRAARRAGLRGRRTCLGSNAAGQPRLHLRVPARRPRR